MVYSRFGPHSRKFIHSQVPLRFRALLSVVMLVIWPWLHVQSAAPHASPCAVPGAAGSFFFLFPCRRGFTKIDRVDYMKFKQEGRIVKDGVTVKVSLLVGFESLAHGVGACAYRNAQQRSAFYFIASVP